jgi:multidrug efflux pump subunit AcrB
MRGAGIGTWGMAMVGVALASGCHTLFADDDARVLVKFPAREAQAVHGAITALERRLITLPGLSTMRSVGCADGGAILLRIDAKAVASGDHAAAVRDAIVAGTEQLPAGAGAIDVKAIADDIGVFTVRAADVFAARAFVDDELAPALEDIPGVYDVVVSGGHTENTIRLDPERLLATDLSVHEVVSAIKVASDLDKVIVKQLPGNVSIFLRDVARLEVAPVGERLRKDGGVEVRVRGHNSARSAAAAVARGIARPTDVVVVALDEDSVEVVTVVVARAGRGGAEGGDIVDVAERAVDAAYADVTAAALSVPGVHTYRRGRHLSLTLDRDRLVRRGLSAADIATVTSAAAAATTGLMVETHAGPWRVIFGAVSTPEALLKTRIFGRTGTAPVRLFDVARATQVEEQREDRIDGRSARRLRLSFDAGVRKRSLDELERRIAAIAAARPGVQVVTERDSDVAPLDAVCP